MKRKTIENKLDKVCSEIVRKIGKCMVCGRTDTVQAHHVIGRRNRQVRWYLNNLVALCSFHHVFGKQSAHQDPVWFLEWYKKFLGKEKYEELRKKSNETKVYATYELEELYGRFQEILNGVAPHPHKEEA